MADIKRYLDDILHTIFGKDVRQSIHDGIKAINDETDSKLKEQDTEISIFEDEINAIVEDNSVRQNLLEQKYNEQIKNIASGEYQNAEIIDARQGFDTLGIAIKQKVYHFENIEALKNCLMLIPRRCSTNIRILCRK